VFAIADELTEADLVLRYRVEDTDDGFSGEEGTFTIWRSRTSPNLANRS
jgi:alpha,alpha-trehalase